MGRVLVACERSGVVRRAFEAQGHDAWSCDIEPADDGSNRHIRGNVFDHLDDGWDLMAVMHPPCTILCNSGAKHLYIGGRKENGRNEARWVELEEAAAFYRGLRDAKQIARRVVENPVMHGHAIRLTRRGFTQFVHPYHFGAPFFKNTGLELINLPPLKPTSPLTPPRPGTQEHKAWSRCHREPPGPDRARRRSETYVEIAEAMATQWSDLLPEPQFDLFGELMAA